MFLHKPNRLCKASIIYRRAQNMRNSTIFFSYWVPSVSLRGFIILLNFRGCVIFLFETVDSISCMAISKCLDMIFERSFVFEIRTTSAIPKLPTVLLMGSPITSHREGLATFSTHEWLDPMLSLVMGLEGSEVFEWL